MAEPYVKTRKRGYRSHFVLWQHQLQAANPGINLGINSTRTDIQNSSVSWTDSLTGVKNPNYKTQIRERTEAGTALSAQSTEVVVNRMIIAGKIISPIGAVRPTYFTERHYGFPAVNFDSMPASPSASVVSDTTNRALRKFLDRCESARSSLEGGQDLGEWKQILRAVTNPMGSLRDHTLSYFTKLKKARRRYRDAPSRRKALADSYLEYTFGWQPLVSDVAKGIVAMQNLSRHYDLVPIDASATATYAGENVSYTTPSDLSIYTVGVRGQIQSRGIYQVRFKGMIRTNADNGNISAAQAFRLLPENFLPTAWDLLPYSFVADYFLNIGDLVRAYSFQRANLAWCVKTIRTIKRKVYTPREVFDSHPAGNRVFLQKSFTGGNAMVEMKDVQRIISPSLIPDFRFHLPVSYKPWLNMAALLLSRSTPMVPYYQE